MTNQNSNGIFKLGVLIKPQAKKSEIVDWLGNRLKVAIAAPAIDGKANHELIRFMAKTLGIKKQDVIIANGNLSSFKLLHLPLSMKSRLMEIIAASCASVPN